MKKIKEIGLAVAMGLIGITCGPGSAYDGESCAIELNDENFESEVLKSETPVLVDFYAEQCMICSEMKPLFDKLSCEYEGQIKFGEYNSSEDSYYRGYYGIDAFPSFGSFCHGEPMYLSVGRIPEEIFRIMLGKTIEECK